MVTHSSVQKTNVKRTTLCWMCLKPTTLTQTVMFLTCLDDNNCVKWAMSKGPLFPTRVHWFCVLYNHVLVVTFPFCKSLFTNESILSLPQVKMWMNFNAYGVLIFNCIFFTCKKTLRNPNIIQPCWNFGYSFKLHLPTYRIHCRV